MEDELEQGDGHHDEAAQEPHRHGGDGVGGWGGGAGHGHHVEEQQDDQQLETQPQHRLGYQE